MRKTVLALVIVASGQLKAKLPDRFDFLCMDGQHFKNAQIVANTRKYYEIKLDFIPETVFIDKSILKGRPRKSLLSTQNPDHGKSLPSSAGTSVSLSGKYYMEISPIAGVQTSNTGFSGSPFKPNLVAGGRLGVSFPDTAFLKISGLHILGQHARFEEGDRFVGITSVQAGPEWSINLSKSGIFRPSLRLGAGISRLYLRGYEITRDYITFSASAQAGFTINFSRLSFECMGISNYIYDEKIKFTVYGIQIGAGVRL